MEVCFGCDAFFSMLEMSSATDAINITMLCETLAAKLKAVPAEELEEPFAPFGSLQESLLKVCMTVLTLFHPSIGHMGCSVKDMLEVQQLRCSSNAMLTTLQARLSENETLAGLCQEVIKFGVSSKKHHAKFTSLLNSLSQDQVSEDILKEAIHLQPTFKRDLRPLHLQPFNQDLAKQISSSVADALQAAADNSATLDSDQMTLLTKGLELFPSSSALMEQKMKLAKYVAENKSRIMAEQFMKFGHEVTQEDFNMGMFQFDLLGKNTPPLNEIQQSTELAAMAELLVPVVIRATKHKAGYCEMIPVPYAICHHMSSSYTVYLYNIYL